MMQLYPPHDGHTDEFDPMIIEFGCLSIQSGLEILYEYCSFFQQCMNFVSDKLVYMCIQGS